MSDKPCYCLGQTTIERVSNEGQLQTDHVDFVAADELFHKDPYALITKLTKENSELRAKLERAEAACCELKEALRYFAQGDPIADHAFSTQCGVGLLEKVKRLTKLLSRFDDYLAGGAASFMPTRSEIKQALAKTEDAK